MLPNTDMGDSVNLPRLGKPCVLIPRSKKSGAKGTGELLDRALVRAFYRKAGRGVPLQRSSVKDTPRGPLLLVQPFFEAGFTNGRVDSGKQFAILEHGVEVACGRVGDDLAGVPTEAEAFADEIVETELLGTGDLNGSV